MTTEPEDHGATAVGLYYLGEDYLEAARVVAVMPRKMNSGPSRLLCLHACELFLKATLRRRGHSHEQLRALMHNLPDIADRATGAGVDVGADLRNRLKVLTEIKAYVTSRYDAGSDRGPYSTADAAIRLAEELQRLSRVDLGL